jgi:hypothetical protein
MRIFGRLSQPRRTRQPADAAATETEYGKPLNARFEPEPVEQFGIKARNG